MLNNMLVHGLDPSTRRPHEIEVVGKALKVYLASLLSGEDQTLGWLDTVNGAYEYFQASGVTTAQDITLGSVGAVGDYLESVTIYNGAASAATPIVIKDGSTTLAFIVPASLAAGASVTIPVGFKSVVGGWKVNITCAGTMSAIKIGAKGRLT